MNERDPVATEEFRAKWSSAFNMVVDSPQNRDHLERFRFAYEYRARFPWLDENRDDGLRRAIEDALSSYKESPIDADYEGSKSLDAEFLNRLKEAGSKVSERRTYLELFADKLSSSNAAISEYELQSYIVKALDGYSLSATAGTSA